MKKVLSHFIFGQKSEIMNNKPDFIDNINDNTLANVLKSIFENLN